MRNVILYRIFFVATRNEGEKVKINFGCGKNYREGYLNVDRCTEIKTDLLHDLNNFPLPFFDNSVDEILLIHVLEHIHKNKLKEFLCELHRIIKPGAKIFIETPYFFSSYAVLDLEHENFFVYGTIKYLVEEKFHNYLLPVKFKITKQRFGTLSAIPVYKELITFVANFHPRFYERFLASIIPCDIIQLEMEALK